jgi:hypothetical protein
MLHTLRSDGCADVSSTSSLLARSMAMRCPWRLSLRG